MLLELPSFQSILNEEFIVIELPPEGGLPEPSYADFLQPGVKSVVLRHGKLKC